MLDPGSIKIQIQHAIKIERFVQIENFFSKILLNEQYIRRATNRFWGQGHFKTEIKWQEYQNNEKGI